MLRIRLVIFYNFLIVNKSQENIEPTSLSIFKNSTKANHILVLGWC